MKKILIVVGKNDNNYNLFKNLDNMIIDIKNVSECDEVFKKRDTRYDLFVIDEGLVRNKKFRKLKKTLNKNKKKIVLSSYFNLDNKDKLKVQLFSLLESKKTASNNLIIIGSSTGGPKALHEIIPKIPNRLNGVLVIVQHMPAKFTESLAKRLDTLSSINVKEVGDGELLRPGTVYIAPGDQHLKIEDRNNKLYSKLSSEEKHLGLRPAVDILFKSIKNIDGYRKMSIILTGMGSDGTLGLKGLDSYNIVQDEKSSVTYGMARSALKADLVDKVVPLEDIALEIVKRVGC